MIKKFIAGLIVLITLIQIFSPCALAIELSSADIVFTGRTVTEHLLFKKQDGSISSVKCSIVGHYVGDKFYPAYCVDPSLDGAEKGNYSVNISNYTDNEKVWRVVTNGFPYNNMGLSDDDAFLVTKMAVYCVTGHSNFDMFTFDESKPITVQTYNALKNLVQVVAEDTSIQKQTGTISITKEGDLIENRRILFSRIFCNIKVRRKKF